MREENQSTEGNILIVSIKHKFDSIRVFQIILLCQNLSFVISPFARTVRVTHKRLYSCVVYKNFNNSKDYPKI